MIVICFLNPREVLLLLGCVNMDNKSNNETSRLQIRIPVDLKEQLEKAVKQNVIGMTNSKSLMVSMGLVMLLSQMETSTIDEVYVNSYIPYLNNTSKGDE